AVDGLGVRVEEQLGRVAAVPLRRVVGPVDAVAVALAGLRGAEVAVPDVPVDLGEVDAGLGAVVVVEAQLHPLGDGGEEGEVGAGGAEGGSQGVRTSRPRLHGR